MKLRWLAVLALVGALFPATNVALGQFLPSTDTESTTTCGNYSGQECTIKEIDTCTKYSIVKLTIGTEVVVSRQCSERTIYKSYTYWKEA